MASAAKKILLLDDDYESMLPLKIFLETVHDFTVELTAKKDLLVRLPHEKFDLLCVDLMIHPIGLDAERHEVQNIHFDGVNWQRTGLAFLKQLREGQFSHDPKQGTSPQAPVILLSAVADTSAADVLEFSPYTTHYMEKPFDLDELLERINQLLKDSAV